MKMLLFVFLAICSSLVTANQVNGIHSAVSTKSDLSPEEVCTCTKEPVPHCDCCAEFKIHKDDHKVCVEMTYMEKEEKTRLTLTFDGKVLLCKTVSAAKNPPPLCQGICPSTCSCLNYYNMSHGEDDKWGGCLEFTHYVTRRVLDLNFGCYYLPVKGGPKPTHSLLNFLGLSDNIFNENQQRLQPTFDSFPSFMMSEPLYEEKDPLSFLYKNRLEYDNEKIEVPDKE